VCLHPAGPLTCLNLGVVKTTLLAALLSRVNPVHRMVLVEDAAELRPDDPHVVSLEARPPNVEGAGTVTLRDLVRQALLTRPDRLVVGEVRGAEVPVRQSLTLAAA
jgi:pilus assembly protein CpaF